MSPRWSRGPQPCENPPPSPRSPPLDTIRLSNCRAQTCGTHVLVPATRGPPASRRCGGGPVAHCRPTIRCRQPTLRNAADKAPPCNFARLATDLDIPKTIRQQPVEWDVRLQVTDLQDSLRRSPHTAEDVQLFNMFQYMLKMMVFLMGSSWYRSVARPPNDHRVSAVAALFGLRMLPMASATPAGHFMFSFLDHRA